MISDHSDPLAALGGEESGGQNVYVDQLSSWLVSKGNIVHVLTRHNSPDRQRQEKSPSGYTVFRTPVGPEGFLPKEDFVKYLPAFTKAAADLMRKYQYDIIHSHYWLSGVAAVALKKECDIRVIHTFHSLGKVKHAQLRGIDPKHMKEREQKEQLIVRRADCLLAESSDERRNLLHMYNARPERITVVPAGVDTRVFSPGNKSAARKVIGIRQKNVVLYVGRFVAQKGLPTLLQAYAQVRKKMTAAERAETVLLLVGGDLHEATAKQSQIQRRIDILIRSLKLRDAVRIMGQVSNEELPTYYRAADVCVVPSRYEPFGIVPLEAMSCGTPVVASFVGGMKSTIHNLYTGLHARPESSADFAHKIDILLRNPELRREFGRQAREHMEREFDWQTVCDRVLTCYHATIVHA